MVTKQGTLLQTHIVQIYGFKLICVAFASSFSYYLFVVYLFTYLIHVLIIFFIDISYFFFLLSFVNLFTLIYTVVI